MASKNIPRRQAIPVLYTRGTHYDVGFDMGRTFASIIKSFLQLSGPLNECYLPLYNTEKGKTVYNETLESVKKSFPQYIRELEGIADGAQVEFHKLFLLHVDDITPQSLKHQNTVGDSNEEEAPETQKADTNTAENESEATNTFQESASSDECIPKQEDPATNPQPIGCSTIILNSEDAEILAHTEDALTETLNHFYFVVAHIINDTPQGKYNVKEERFMSLCYAGHLPGYTMNYNHHGLVFSINTISAEHLRGGKTPRHFITRALLSSENFDQALTILKDSGVGAGDGCSVNLTFLNAEPRTYYNIEIGPVVGDEEETQLDIKEIPKGEHNYHCNKYLRLKAEEANQYMIDSSDSRMNSFLSYENPKTKEDVLNMLGDCSGGEHCVFRDNDDLNELVKTIAVGVFDLKAKTYSLYSDNPRNNEPHVTIPLMQKE